MLRGAAMKRAAVVAARPLVRFQGWPAAQVHHNSRRLNLVPGHRWHSTAEPSHDPTMLNPPAANIKLSPERPPCHEFHRHSTRYSRTSREVLDALDKDWMDQPHYEPVTWQDRVALCMVKMLRKASDAYFKDRLLDRACMLETIAAVPGFVAGMIHHMRSLRRSVHCNWIKPTMDEAENERMHLMTFMELAQQRWHQRVMVVCGQGVFFAGYTIFYVLTPRIAHRFVGYLEEEAVHTYTEMLNMVDQGKIKNVPAPKIAIQYWNMPADATLRDVVLVVRADEADHRLVNHHMGDLIANAKGKGPVREGCSDYKPCDEFLVDLSIDLGPTVARRKPPPA